MKINKTLLKAINWALTGLLVLLGFSNCESMEEYGVPNADYTLKGKITDKANAKPIKGIRVGYGKIYEGPITMYGVAPLPYRTYLADTTNMEGEYKLSDNFSVSEIPADEIPVYVQDIDGNENGLYRDTVLQVNFENAKQSGKQKGWYNGEYSLDINIELNKQEEGNE
jgi:putative lipoprotein (rSAM/lipoprotein system)